MEIAIAGLVMFIVLIAIGVPFWANLAGVSIFIIVAGTHLSLSTVSQQMFDAVSRFPLMAIPFFLFAGHVMARGGCSGSIFAMFASFFGHRPAGLPTAVVLLAMVFSALSGSVLATVSAVTVVSLAPMLKQGFPKHLSLGLFAASGTLGTLIPPSITMILYAPMAERSISVLFLSGIFPGIFIGLCLIMVVVILSLRRHFELGTAATWRERLLHIRNSLPALGIPVIILGGIYGGVFTPTEAAAVASVYGLLIGWLVYRQIDWKVIKECTTASLRSTSMIYLLIASACLYGMVLSYFQIPQMLTQAMVGMGLTLATFTLVAMMIIFILGCFMDIVPILFITTPLLLPAFIGFGGDPIHYGIILIACLHVGQVTPPFGMAIFVAAGLGQEPAEQVFRGAFWFLVSMILSAAVLAYVPVISLYLPTLWMRAMG